MTKQRRGYWIARLNRAMTAEIGVGVRPLSHGLGFGRHPRALFGSEADKTALDQVAAPVLQHPGGLVILNPLGHRHEIETAGEINQRLHESAIIGRGRDVLHERAVDLDYVDTELAQ